MCDCYNKNILLELFDGSVSTSTNICDDVVCCLKKQENKQSKNPVFSFVKPEFPCKMPECEKKLINFYGNKVTCFFNKYKNTLLNCVYTGNYAPLISAIPKNVVFELFTINGVLLFTNAMPDTVEPQALLSLNSFYTINLLNYTKNSTNIKCDTDESVLSYTFKILATYNSSLPSSLTLTESGNIIGIYKITDPVVPKS
jgi:hypothetical protein